jgi:hypothetical protein
LVARQKSQRRGLGAAGQQLGANYSKEAPQNEQLAFLKIKGSNGHILVSHSTVATERARRKKHFRE